MEKRTLRYILNEGYDSDIRVSASHRADIKVNGKWCLDLAMGAGTHILGHGFATEEVIKALKWGSLYTSPNILTDECGKLLHNLTGFEHFIFANSGAEATTKAIRIARAYTKRELVVFFQGFWHGTQDYAVSHYSKGIPDVVKNTTIVVPFTNKALEVIEELNPALVMVEPIQSSCPINRREFLVKLRELTFSRGIPLCFDEVISGFRQSIGGASDYYGIRPDLVTYGKIVGGGFPVGVIGGDKILEVVEKGVKMGGTFSANPITITACMTTLKALADLNPYKELHENLQLLIGLKTDKLQVMGVGAMARLMFTPRPITNIAERDEFELPYKEQNSLLCRLREKGIFIGTNHLILPSVLHTREKMLYAREVLQSI